MPTDPIGVTTTTDAHALGVYEAEGGVEVFETSSPYLLSDSRSLLSPILVQISDGPVFYDELGDARDAIPVSGLSPLLPDGITWDANTTWDNGTYWS